MATTTYTFADVEAAGNEPDVAFGPQQCFELRRIDIDTAKVATIADYLACGETTDVARIHDLIASYRTDPASVPPVLARADGHVEDGAHRLAALDVVGETTCDAFVALA